MAKQPEITRMNEYFYRVKDSEYPNKVLAPTDEEGIRVAKIRKALVVYTVIDGKDVVLYRENEKLPATNET